MAATVSQIQKIEIRDELSRQAQAAIEVDLWLSDGTRRWCFFMNPVAFQAGGDWIEGTQIRFHFGAPHMIVVAATLTEELIRQALQDIEQRGEMLRCTRPFEEPVSEKNES